MDVGTDVQGKPVSRMMRWFENCTELDAYRQLKSLRNQSCDIGNLQRSETGQPGGWALSPAFRIRHEPIAVLPLFGPPGWRFSGGFEPAPNAGPLSAGWLARFKTLRHDYEHHMEEEEQDIFETARQVMSDDADDMIAHKFEKRKRLEREVVDEKAKESLVE